MTGTVVVAGAGGLVGSVLAPRFRARGAHLLRLVRRAPQAAGEVGWDPVEGRLEREGLAGARAAVNLCGENVAAGRWTDERKRRMRRSRVDSTRLLARTLASLDPPPAVLVNASAIGFYGDRGDEELDESSAPGGGYLAELSQEWEAACEPAEKGGIRVVKLRIGIVLSRNGGALAKMLPLFRLGLGGRLGSGKQFWSWIGLHDLVRVIEFAVARESLSGPLNAVSPEPVRNAGFTRALGRALRRPTPFPAPAAAIRLAMGQMGREMLLSGARVSPRKLAEAGFRFEHPGLDSALAHELGKET